MRSSLRTLLLAQTGITDLVGAEGVFLQHAKQGQPLPYVVLIVDDTEEHNTLDGASGSFRNVDFQIDCKGRTGGEAAQLAETLREFLKDYAGAAGSQTIDAVIVDGEYDSVERPVDGSDKKTFVVTLELTIQYHPA